MTKVNVVALILLTSSIALAQEAQPVASPVQSPVASPVQSPYASTIGTTEQPKHQITFGNDSFGWDGSAATTDTDKSLGIKDFTFGEGNFNVNYAYQIFPQVQIGAEIISRTEVQEIKYDDGGKYTDDDSTTTVGAFVTYNTSEEINNSFFITAGISKSTVKSETKDTSDNSKSSTKYDASIFSGAIGKRFSMQKLGIQNLVYSPKLTVASGKFSGDLEESGVNSAVQVKIDVLRFDLLF